MKFEQVAQAGRKLGHGLTSGKQPLAGDLVSGLREAGLHGRRTKTGASGCAPFMGPM